MKIELSDDQNTLVIVGGQFEGQYKATGQDGCASCSFWIDEICELKTFSACVWTARKDQQSIIWIKKEVEQITETPAPAPAPHRHFDLIVAWAKDPTQQVWFWNVDEWQKAEYLVWHMEHYVLGDKPTSPPMKKLKVKIELDRNEFEIEVPYDARPQEVDKAILDMATQFMRVTQEPI